MKRAACGSYRSGWAVFVSAALLAMIAGAANLNGSGASLNLSTSDLYSATAQANANGGRLSSAGVPYAGTVTTNTAGARAIIEPMNAVAGADASAGATAEFSASPLSGGVPLQVQFADHSSGGLHGIVTWAWDFGDGSPVDTGQNPAHEYKTSGTYSVTLTIATQVDGSVKTKHGYIAVLPGLPAAGWGGMLMLAAALAAAGGLLVKKQAMRLARWRRTHGR